MESSFIKKRNKIIISWIKKESFQNFESFLFMSKLFRIFYLANSSFTVLVLIPLVTFFIPLYSRIAFACPLLFPVLQKTITDGFPLNSFNLLSTSSSGIFTAPFTLPSANSCGVLTDLPKMLRLQLVL